MTKSLAREHISSTLCPFSKILSPSVKVLYGKENGIYFYHYVQAFHPDDDLTPEEANRIGMELAKEWAGHEVLVATHVDRKHLSVMIRRLENLIDGQALTEELMTETAEKYLSAMKKTAEETNASVKKTLENLDRMYTQQVGKANEMLSERIERRAIRDDVLWWVRLLGMALPTILVLVLSVCYGWLPLG